MGAHARLRGRASVAAYTVPTDAPESDGTLEWNATTLVVVSLEAGGRQGIGYTYADTATAKLIHERLLPLVQCRDPLDIPAVFHAMAVSVRNLGRPGIASMAISAVDAALWDLKAKLLGASLADLLGTARAAIPVYGSGGFTSYSAERLQAQLAGWADAGFAHVKMKAGRDPDADWSRVKAAREAIGPDCALFVDANGAYTRKQALAFAERFAQSGVGWFEEPVSSEDLEGLRLLRDRVPGGMDVSAGEYGYDRFYFRRMLQAQAVDVLQADATRCGGITGFMAVAGLADAFGVPLSSHCAPSLHLAACCAAQRVVHLEYFHDHVRIEQMLFDGFREPKDGAMAPERSRPGLGIELKASDAERYRS
ncbi:MAG: mandelate racemase [Betaproteobacteria bacterium]|nr:MAG: mandelate racemase [Betaproteobacteria bacterium]